MYLVDEFPAMSNRWQRVGRGLLVVCTVLLLISSGVVFAHGGESTETPVTTSHHDSKSSTQTSEGHHNVENSTETSDRHHEGGDTAHAVTQHRTDSGNQTSNDHAHGGNAEATAAGHHASNQENSTGHAHGEHDEGELPGGWMTIIGGLFLLGAITTAPTYRYVKSTGRSAISSIHLVGALLALFTAAVHLYLFFNHGTAIMLLAGLGFLGGVVLLFAGIAQQYLYTTGIVYTLAQIILWVNDGMPHLTSFGLLDKVAQAALIVVLGYLYVRDSSRIEV